jgi:hypothetical protein
VLRLRLLLIEVVAKRLRVLLHRVIGKRALLDVQPDIEADLCIDAEDLPFCCDRPCDLALQNRDIGLACAAVGVLQLGPNRLI